MIQFFVDSHSLPECLRQRPVTILAVLHPIMDSSDLNLPCMVGRLLCACVRACACVCVCPVFFLV
jgi:hypothetical protein